MLEEVDESELWLELLPEANAKVDADRQRALLGEAGELVAIFSASHRTARENLAKRKAHKKKGRVT